MSQTLDVSHLPESVVKALETIVEEYRQSTSKPHTRPVGWAQLPELPASFFEALPDELIESFQGGQR